MGLRADRRSTSRWRDPGRTRRDQAEPVRGAALPDMGAEAGRPDRSGLAEMKPANTRLPRRRTIRGADPGNPSVLAPARELVDSPQVLVEGIRPTVMQPPGPGPQGCHPSNPWLTLGRLRSWGQDGPLAPRYL